MSIVGKQLACQIQSRKGSDFFLNEYGFGGQYALKALLTTVHPDYKQKCFQLESPDLLEEEITHDRMFFEELKTSSPESARTAIQQWRFIPIHVLLVTTGKTHKQWLHLVQVEIEMKNNWSFWDYYTDYSHSVKEQTIDVDCKASFLQIDMFAEQHSKD